MEIPPSYRICKEQLALDNHAGKVVLVCGAGVTIDAYGDDKANWTAFLKNAVRYAATRGVDGAIVEAMNSLLDKPQTTVEERLKVGDDLVAALVKLDVLKYWLRDEVEFVFKKSDTPLLKAIAACSRLNRVRLATTNYDFLLEHARGWKPSTPVRGFTWLDESDATSWQQGYNGKVYHLHGHARNSASIVLGAGSYDSLNANQWIAQLRSAMALNDTVIFLGCGDTLKDRAFTAIFDQFAEVQARSQDRYWFQLVRNSEVPHRDLVALPFGNLHPDLPNFLNTHLLPWLSAGAAAQGAAGAAVPTNGLHATVDVALAAPPEVPAPILPDSSPPAAGTANIRDTALAELAQGIAVASKDAPAQPFFEKLVSLLKIGQGSDLSSVLIALDQLSFVDQLGTICDAVAGVELAQAKSNEDHPIEIAARGLYLRAAMRAVKLDAALLRLSQSPALVDVPGEEHVVIAVLIAVLRGELTRLRLVESADHATRQRRSGLRGDGLIDLTEVAPDYLKTIEAVETETAARVDKLTVKQYQGYYNPVRPTDPDERQRWLKLLQARVGSARRNGTYFRLLVETRTSGVLRDDAQCEALFADFSIPVVRVKTGSEARAETLALMGIDGGVLDYHFGELERTLADARLRGLPSATAKAVAPDQAALHAELLKLVKENQELKARLGPQVEHMEAKPNQPNKDALKEVHEAATKARDIVGIYSDAWKKAYELSSTLLNLIQ